MARQARRWSSVDDSKLGVVGHSMGSQFLLQWAESKKYPAKALVRLDTTAEYAPESDRQFDYLRKAMQKLTPPRIL